jgi:hypothetical protein
MKEKVSLMGIVRSFDNIMDKEKSLTKDLYLFVNLNQFQKTLYSVKEFTREDECEFIEQQLNLKIKHYNKLARETNSTIEEVAWSEYLNALALMLFYNKDGKLINNTIWIEKAQRLGEKNG